MAEKVRFAGLIVANPLRPPRISKNQSLCPAVTPDPHCQWGIMMLERHVIRGTPALHRPYFNNVQQRAET